MRLASVADAPERGLAGRWGADKSVRKGLSGNLVGQIGLNENAQEGRTVAERA